MSFSVPSAPPPPAQGQPSGAVPVSVPVGMSGGLAGRGGVPLGLPLPYLLTGITMAAAFGAALPWIAPEALRSPEMPRVLALVHTATLGWLTMIILGASFQLAPVMLVAPLRGTRFVRWQFPVFAGGAALLVAGFWAARPWLVATGGALVVIAVAHYTVVMARTLLGATQRPLSARYLAAAVTYLCIVVSLGLTTALNLALGFLGAEWRHLLLAHIALGLAGWLSMTLIGVSYTLVRMFALAHGHDDRIGKVVFVALNAGVVVLALGVTLGWEPLIALGGTALAGSTWLFAYDYAQMLRARRRRLLDVTQWHGMASVAYLTLVVPLGALAMALGWNEAGLVSALGLMALVGWLGQSTLGYLYKIVPFLIWHNRYGPQVGRRKVPLMKEMVREDWQRVSFWLVNLGLPLAALALALGEVWALRVAGAAVGAGLMLGAVNIWRVLRA